MTDASGRYNRGDKVPAGGDGRRSAAGFSRCGTYGGVEGSPTGARRFQTQELLGVPAGVTGHDVLRRVRCTTCENVRVVPRAGPLPPGWAMLTRCLTRVLWRGEH